MKVARIGIATRIQSLAVGAVVGLVAIAALILYSNGERLRDERGRGMGNAVDIAYAVIASFADEEKAGRLSHEAAQKAAAAAVSVLRYGSDGYFWINDLDGRIIMHPIKPALDGADGGQIKDPTGVSPFLSAVEATRATGQGAFTYYWPKPDAEKPVEKLSHGRRFPPWGWVVASGVYMDDVRADLRASVYRMGGVVLVVAVLVAFGAWIIARGVIRPLRAITAAMTELSTGNTTVTVPALDRADEIAEMAKALEVFKSQAIENRRLEADRDSEIERRGNRQKEVENSIAAFDDSVRSALEGLATAASEMQATSKSMSSTAVETSERATTVAAASEQASANVGTVVEAAEQLAASISEISKQVTHSAAIAGRATREAERTNEMVEGLATAALKIGEVVKLIQAIASQTNLLALNATIEAARAGDAGKGFAVVANEVKNLANQTARATEEIAQQIGEIQAATEGAVEAIKGIGGRITEINEISTAIAAAVEEQGAATHEISRHTQEAARGTEDVSSTILGVSHCANETGAAASKVLDASSSLGTQTDRLRAEIDRFLTSIIAA